MKTFLIPLVWLMVPVAFVVVAFDVAKAWVEEKVEAKLKEKNT
jgi:hypothetical protein